MSAKSNKAGNSRYQGSIKVEQVQSKKRRVYLKMTTVEEAHRQLQSALTRLESDANRKIETIPTRECRGRVTAQAVFASKCNPHYCASAMDGYSVRASATTGASESSPVSLTIPDEAKAINTGEQLPEGHDSVIMIEDVFQCVENKIEIMASAAPWQHVRLLGEDIVATELIVTSGQRLGAVEVAAMVASQVQSVAVVKKPQVALLPTGSEVVRGDQEQPLKAGQVLDYDTPLLAGMIEEWGGEAVIGEPIPDDPARIREALLSATESFDIVALIAGSSAGTADHVPNTIEELGELLFHGVRLSPGKPTALGIVNNSLVIGVPGYSVAAWTAFDLFAKPAISHFLGIPELVRQRVEAQFRRKVPSRSGMHELLRVRLARVGEDLIAIPLKRGAGAINSLAQADGLAHVCELDEGVNPGEPVEVELLKPAAELERTVLAVGSHDIALDLLAAELIKPPYSVRLAAAHVGSMGGLRALRQRETHCAGIHLLDPEDGSYNISYIKRILPDLPLQLINLVHREVGLMVLPSNPRGILSIADLARDDIIMINRQRGAGTRVLLDYLLKEAELEPKLLRGYEREVTTHTMVAAAVFGGAADTGLGIRAAAQALGLDFVPLTMERYDLAVPREHLEHEGVRHILSLLRTETESGRRFRETVLNLGGYDFKDTNKVLYEQ